MFIDSHCHLDFDVLYNDLGGVLNRMKEAEISACVTISTRVEEFAKITALSDAHENVWCSVGTHPHNADEELHIKTADLVRLSAHSKCVAIGEAGLDYHYDNASVSAQKTSFLRHIAAARQTRLPLVIHARSADEDMIDILREETGKGAFPFVLHCFSSGARLAEVGLELGGYLSFSGIVTFKNATDILDIAKSTPANRILVETDAPYLAPVPLRGRSNEPAFVRYTAEHLANARGVSLQTLGQQTSENFFRLFAKAGAP